MMGRSSEALTEDPLFLACTRPAMIAGAPMEAVGINLIVSATLFLIAHSPLYLLIAPVLHVVAQAICKHDQNALRVMWMGLQTRGRQRNGAVWGGSSMSPLPLRRRYRAGEVDRG